MGSIGEPESCEGGQLDCVKWAALGSQSHVKVGNWTVLSGQHWGARAR